MHNAYPACPGDGTGAVSSRDGKLSVDEFGALCRALFRDAAGSPYPLEIKKLAHMFSAFDTNQVRSPGFRDRLRIARAFSPIDGIKPLSIAA